MANMVKSFQELTPEFQNLAGGKGDMLARMFQSGYPVLEGFVIFKTSKGAVQLPYSKPLPLERIAEIAKW